MIESSIIKLVLIAALNIYFVWIWVEKESFKRVMPFEFIRKLEKISFFKKIKKLISLIGNINIFWIFNILYLALIKYFEKDLNLILGFPEGITKDGMFETNVLKLSYIYANSLGGVTKFLFDSGNFIGLFIGVTALMIPIYLYIIGFKSKSKRQLLLMLTKKGDMFYISFFIYVMLFFKVEKIFLVGAIGYLIYLLMEAVKWIMKIENSLYSFKGLGKLLKSQEEEEIVELYNATLNELYQGVKDSNASATDENKKLLLLLLRDNIIKIENTKNKENTKDLIRTLYDIYDVAIKNQDDDIFRTISYLYVNIAKYYRKKNDKEHFYWALCGMGKVYDYSYKNGTDKFKSAVVSEFIYNDFGIWETYKENFEEGIEWYSQVFKVITEGIKKAVENDDFYFFQQFTYLIEKQFKRKREIKKDYKLLEKSVYFGIILYLKEEKRKSKDNEDRFKKMDEYIEFIEKLLSNKNIIDLIELYEFIDEEIYGWNEEYRDRLHWDKYFERRSLVKVSFDQARTEGEKDNLFFELLGKVNYFQHDKNILLNTDDLERYFERKAKEDREKSIKRINKFKKNVGYLLGDFQIYKDKIMVTKESDKKIKDFFKKIVEQNKQERDEKIREAKVLESKIELTKTILTDIMKDLGIIKMLKGVNKYKSRLEEKKNKIQCLGINEYMQKEFFTEIDLGNGIEFIVKDLGKIQNEGIERIIINSLDERSTKSEENLEKVLEKIKGKPWIILTGIYIGDFFYNSEDGSLKENIIIKSDLNNGYFEKYGEILKGIYKYNGIEIPIYDLDRGKEGIYILDSNDIEAFIHYDPNLEIKDSKDVEKEIDEIIGYASLKITDTKKILEKREKEVLKYEWLQDYGSDKAL